MPQLGKGAGLTPHSRAFFRVQEAARWARFRRFKRMAALEAIRNGSVRVMPSNPAAGAGSELDEGVDVRVSSPRATAAKVTTKGAWPEGRVWA